MARAQKRTFYYSSSKLSYYLLFNCGLLALAYGFCLTLFPEFIALSGTVIFLCALSLFSVIFVILRHRPLAIIDNESIIIDRCQPLLWQKVTGFEKKTVSKGYFKKKIITFSTTDLDDYKLNFMQRLIKDSEFTAFSIPLYAMDDKDARAIERLIKKHLK